MPRCAESSAGAHMPGGIFLAGGEELTAAFADAHATLLARASTSLVDIPSRSRYHHGRTSSPRAHVAFLPSADAGDGDGIAKYWASRAVEHFRAVGADRVEAVMFLHERDHNRRDLLRQIDRASVIYLGGGKPHLLRKLLRGSLIWEHICRAYETGKWLAGTSAGAMVLGELTPVHMDASCPQPTAWEPGLSVLPGISIIPHYDTWPETDIANIVHAAPNWLTLACIDERTGLIGEAKLCLVAIDLPTPALWTVVGHGRVMVRAGGQYRVYHPGDWLTYPASHWHVRRHPVELSHANTEESQRSFSHLST